jgi:hypothetical protein
MTGRPPWEPDLSALLLRLAQRLEDDGVPHPVEAAVALTIRGRRGLSRRSMAAELELDEAALARAEAGELRVGQWPRSLWRVVEDEAPEFATLLHPARAHPTSTASRHWGSLA